ncbi:unnamed protein product [Cercopithifilaria johnstoni]|uniref:Ig-like domain-containing protein n=1 Tax=Cercopithifilaria johnstoni TaxID=2874296 RepID=A0A8J2PTZ7_9BILA|nr:unnamed protein product [Cercopithifilaria johnstoni]
MSVVGFDFGNVSSFIAVARQGGIETIANDYSLRATPSCVAFTTRGRLMGVAARQQLNTNIKNTIINFKHLLGRKFSDKITQKYRKFIPCEMVQLPNDDIGFKVQYFDEERVLTPEQVVAIFLVKLKDIAENSSQMKNVADCVISVPFYFVDAQRRALLTAIRVAGLNCLQILNETTSVALAYGIYKQDLPAENEPPRIVAFIDVGHSAAQAVLVAYNKGKLTVLGATFDLEVGGLAFDDVIRDYFSKLFSDTYKIDVASNKRAWFRLLDECEKIKKQMSTNSTAIPLNIECFMNDMDVTGNMQRSQFEELAQPLLDRVRVLLTKLLKECGKKAEEVESVELIGGSSRIPAIKKITFEVFGKEPKTTMNQDEAVARGAAMKCAILSPVFKVRDFSVKDSQPYRIKLSWAAIGQSEGGENDVFIEHDEFPYSKMLTLYRQEAFQVDATYSCPNQVPHPIRHMGSWVVKNLTPGPNNEPRKVKVKVRINPNGIFSVCSANTFETVEASPLDTQIHKAPEAMETDDTKRDKEENADATTSNVIPPAEDQKLLNNNGQKTKTIAMDLPVEEHIPHIIANELQFMQFEKEMQGKDRVEKEKADAKNAVEEYVYYIRDKLSDVFAEFISDDDAEKLRELLTKTEDWLYDEGEDVEKKVYDAKMSELKKLGDPVHERHREYENRKNAFDEFDRAIMRARKAYDEYTKGSEKYAHLGSTDMEKVISIVEEKKKWVDDQRSRQEMRKKTEPPIVFVHQIQDEQQKLESIILPILNKPKPPPPAKAEPTKEPEKGSEGQKGENLASDRAPEADAGNINEPGMEVD